MAFTDDDVEQLGLACESTSPIIREASYLEALLARLEAAERLSEERRYCLQRKCEPWPCKAETDANNNWLRSAGKGEA